MDHEMSSKSQSPPPSSNKQQSAMPDILPDLKDLLICIFDTVGASQLTSRYQIKILHAINNKPASVIEILADYYLAHLAEVQQQLSTTDIAVTIAFARRIVDSDCADSVAAVSALAFSRYVCALVMKNGDCDLKLIHELIKALAEELHCDDIISKLNALEIFKTKHIFII
ncbi:unnamed protein product [Gongylonema pulchrum]|uniref:Adaptin_N domain-containing protein n=1 Tax=Gongylonema pulchrum TaxID=637853 RepID=A0A183EDC2_9BILA|nr:unnamed protein product [Gongylonema pulchrum]